MEIYDNYFLTHWQKKNKTYFSLCLSYFIDLFWKSDLVPLDIVSTIDEESGHVNVGDCLLVFLHPLEKTLANSLKGSS